jgi:hypothetical protein
MNIKIKIVCDTCNEECELVEVETYGSRRSRNMSTPLETYETEYRIKCSSCDQKIRDLEIELEELTAGESDA